MILSAGNLLSAALILARNIVIARMISVEDFGIAATFALIVTIVETGTNIAVDRLVVQDQRGDRANFLSALHAVQLGRGLIGATLVLLLAVPFSHVMGVPDLAWAYQTLALVPLVRSIIHLDMFRAQRHMQFAPHVISLLAGNAIALLSAWPLSLWFGDFRVMLAAVLLQQVFSVAASHAVANQRYRLRWDPEIARHSLTFGLPLMLNGAIMFAALHGDQMLVGSFLGMETLGWFAVAFAITLVPTTILANTLQSLLLPRLADEQQKLEAFATASRNALLVCCVAATVLGLGIAAIGPIAIKLLFGERYLDALTVLPWLAVLQAIRLAKAGPAIIAIARGETRDPLLANIPRLLMIPIAVFWMAQGGDVFSIISAALIGEVAALAFGCLLLLRRGVLTAPARFRDVRHG